VRILYAVEADIRGCSAEERQRVRFWRSKPLVDALKPWFESQLAAVSGKSTIAEAIRYVLTRWRRGGENNPSPRHGSIFHGEGVFLGGQRSARLSESLGVSLRGAKPGFIFTVKAAGDRIYQPADRPPARGGCATGQKRRYAKRYMEPTRRRGLDLLPRKTAGGVFLGAACGPQSRGK